MQSSESANLSTQGGSAACAPGFAMAAGLRLLGFALFVAGLVACSASEDVLSPTSAPAERTVVTSDARSEGPSPTSTVPPEGPSMEGSPGSGESQENSGEGEASPGTSQAPSSSASPERSSTGAASPGEASPAPSSGASTPGPGSDAPTLPPPSSVESEPPTSGLPAQRVGIFYLAWHAYAATAMRQIPEAERLTAEDIIRSPDRFFSEMLLSRGLFNAAAGFHWHVEPELGFYCLYRAREGEEGILPDCPNIEETARVHAELLVEAGVDFIFADLTNLPEENEFADALGLRPVEVLFEEWQALRDAGTPTPQIAVWVPATELAGAEAPLFRRVIELYQRPEYASLVLEHVPTGEPVLFVVDSGGFAPSEAFLAEIRDAGIIPVRLWGLLPEAALQEGTAAWMQPCTRDGEFTTILSWDEPCDQFWSPNTPIGSVVSVSASYQIGYASLPWQASGQLGGQTLRQQFATAFEVQPDYLLINAWNEHIAQPQANPFDESLGNLRQSMGIVDVPAGDSSAPWLWVDAYGHDLSRDLEPTVEGGRKGYDLLRACITAYRGGEGFCDTAIGAVNACCLRSGGMRAVRHAVLSEGAWWASSHVPTTNIVELELLVDSGAYVESCNFSFAPPGFCSTTSQANGPFLVFPEGGAERAPLHRCLKSPGNNTHLLSLEADCEGAALEGVLGWVSTRQTSETPRALRRCLNTGTERHFHVLDEGCPAEPGVVDQGLLGYVR